MEKWRIGGFFGIFKIIFLPSGGKVIASARTLYPILVRDTHFGVLKFV